MRVAIITLGVYPTETGGVQLHSFYQALGLKRAGWDVIILTRRKGGGRTTSDLGGVVVESLGSGSPLVGQLAFVLHALVILVAKRKDVDVVHVHYATYFMLPAFIFHLLTSKPFVVTCHGFDVVYLKKSIVWKAFQTIAFRAAAMVTATSTQVRDLLRREYQVVTTKSATIPNGVDEQEALAAYSKGHAVIDRRDVAFVANLRPVKDPLSVFQAIRIASNHVANLRLIVVGGGPMLQSLRQRVEEDHLEDKIVLKGELPHPTTLEMIAGCELLVLGSVHEGGNPLVVVEAMALGKPVVATDVGGVRDIVVDGTNGFLVPVGSPESMAERMVELLQDPTLAAEMGKSARRTAEAYSWEAIVKEYIEIYEKAMHQTDRQGSPG